MDEKLDIDIGLNKVVAPKHKRDYLCNLELFTTPLDTTFGVTSHFINSHDGKTDSGNQPKHQLIKKLLLAVLLR